MTEMIFPSIDMEATGRNIKNFRKERRLKVVDVQDFFDFNTPQAIYKWERGECLPTVDNLVILTMIFKCKIEDLIVID